MGPGIWRFAFAWLSNKDSHYERRVDFMLSRIGGTDMRLHPHTPLTMLDTGLQEAIPVRGSWEGEWCPETSPAHQHQAACSVAGQTPAMFGDTGNSAAGAIRAREATLFDG